MNQDVLLLAKLARYEAALEKIAAPRRPDGTYNLGREACEQIARDALVSPHAEQPVPGDEYAPADLGDDE